MCMSFLSITDSKGTNLSTVRDLQEKDSRCIKRVEIRKDGTPLEIRADGTTKELEVHGS